jgi:uncharacterized protein YkwD
MLARTLVLTGLLLCAACTVPVSVPRSAPAAAAAVSDATVEAVANELLAAVNRARADNGLRPLRRVAALTRAAREHSEELAERRTLEHTSTNPARRTMTMRIEAAGGTWSRAAENLANMSGPASDVPWQSVQLWLNSAGHRRNMLESAYTQTGVGIAIDQRGIWYITQLYVVPRTGR